MSRLIDVDALITQQALRQDIIERLCNMGSVIVKGMEMPQKCGQCKLYHAEHPMHCMAVEGHRTVGAPYGMSRPDWCPLVEIPTSHGRLIDADKLLEKAYWDYNEATHDYNNFKVVSEYDIADAPTVIKENK